MQCNSHNFLSWSCASCTPAVFITSDRCMQLSTATQVHLIRCTFDNLRKHIASAHYDKTPPGKNAKNYANVWQNMFENATTDSKVHFFYHRSFFYVLPSQPQAPDLSNWLLLHCKQCNQLAQVRFCDSCLVIHAKFGQLDKSGAWGCDGRT